MSILRRIFKREGKNWSWASPADSRWLLLTFMIKDLSKSQFEKLIELETEMFELINKNKKIKTPDQVVSEAGGFLLHNDDGVVK